MEPVNSENNLETLSTFLKLFLTMLVNFILSFEFQKLNNLVLKILTYNPLNSIIISRTIVLTTLILITPLLICVVSILLIYKYICGALLKQKDKQFVKFFDNFDVFWNLNKNNLGSVINVLGLIETASPYKLVNKIKDKLVNLKENKYADKIFYRKEEAFGFYYWQKSNTIDINEYVNIIDTQTEYIYASDLEIIMSAVSKQSLPYNDKGLFKILITKQRLNINNSFGNHCIIFRIDHSVGDGVALFNFLCKSLVDEDISYCNIINKQIPAIKSKFDLNLMTNAAICFVDGILRKPDENGLHGPVLTGNKIFKWIGKDDNLFEIIKDIKKNMEDVKFTDILATSLSYGLNKFFTRKTKMIPENVAVVLPVRLSSPPIREDQSHLENDFSVTILDVPIKDTSFEIIRERCKKMRTSADALTNYYFLNLVCKIFPNCVLKPLLNSSQATLILSNLPGPKSISICGEKLKELVFFVPHQGNTGIGVTSLYYGGVLQLAIMADTALISDSKDLEVILDGMKEGLKLLHSKYVK